MVRLVDDLLDVSRIRRNKLELRKERVDLGSVLSQAVEACGPFVECANHDLIVDLPTKAIHLLADHARLVQVFTNLLSNACKYTDDGGSIRLNVERKDQDVIVKIRDTGIGIPANKLTSVFEMFAQIQSLPERSRGGLGIGLTVVKRLVEMHGGSVSVSSEGPGRGSEFSVRLPILVKDHPELPSRRETDRERTVSARRILVVDDDADSAASLALLLRMSGNETAMAHDGQAAVAAVESFRPDVVLMDISLPKLDGHDAARRIREEPWGKDVVLVALTGWGQEEDRRKSRDAGFDEHMVKPVDYDALMRFLHSV
jgi:CheY-like chemotaxis protein